MCRKRTKITKPFNDKLHKAQDKENAKKAERAALLKSMVRKFNQNTD
jgi:hypothetical protein